MQMWQGMSRDGVENTCMPAPVQGMSREGGETAGGVLPHATSLRGIIRHRLKHLSLLSSPSARISEEGGEEEGHAAGQAPEPISRYEISPPKDAGMRLNQFLFTSNPCFTLPSQFCGHACKSCWSCHSRDALHGHTGVAAPRGILPSDAHS
jgi:hypothetical protein